MNGGFGQGGFGQGAAGYFPQMGPNINNVNQMMGGMYSSEQTERFQRLRAQSFGEGESFLNEFPISQQEEVKFNFDEIRKSMSLEGTEREIGSSGEIQSSAQKKAQQKEYFKEKAKQFFNQENLVEYKRDMEDRKQQYEGTTELSQQEKQTIKDNYE